MEKYHILSKVSNPESTPIPCPYICLRDTEDILSSVATHLNTTTVSHPLASHIEPTPDEWTVETVKEAIPSEFMASSSPLFGQINFTDIREETPNRTTDSYEEQIISAIAHETLHIVLFHIEGETASEQLDSIEEPLRE